MVSEALNEYIDTFAPSVIREEKTIVNEETFLVLKFETQQGIKLGVFEVAFKANKDNPADKFTLAYDVLTTANATIKDRYHSKEYAFSYWLYGTDKIYRQKRKETAL
jgi:hypothetical protein